MTPNPRCGQFDALLPWYVNGTASATDRSHLEAHLLECVGCRGRLRDEQTLLQHIRNAESAPASDSEESWQRFESTLGGTAPAGESAAGSVRWLRWVAGAQAAALAVLAVLLAQSLWNAKRGTPDFHTVTTAQSVPAPTQFALRIAAAPDITPATIARIARDHGARVIDGPSKQGVYTLQLNLPAVQQQVLTQLRELPELQLVEQIGETR